MTVQLELPLFQIAEVGEHSASLQWSPGGLDGTYTVTCDCDHTPVTSTSWEEWQAKFNDHADLPEEGTQ